LILILFQDLAGLVSFFTSSVCSSELSSFFVELFRVASLLSCQGSSCFASAPSRPSVFRSRLRLLYLLVDACLFKQA